MQYLLSLFIALVAFTQCNSPENTSTTTETATTAKTGLTKQTNEVIPVEDYVKMNPELSDYSVATFAGGCFWCTEAAFERIRGVKDVISGYAGGKGVPSYRSLGGPGTHVESIQIWYDAEVVSYETLLDVLFVAHDPTQVDRQGPDVGAQYRSEVWYHNDEQKKALTDKIAYLNKSGKFSKPIATRVSSYDGFYVAEGYHQNYYELPPYSNAGYVANVTRPKVEKVIATFPELLKEEYK